MRPNLIDLQNETLYKEIASFHIDDTMKFLMDSENFGKPVEANETENKKSKYLKLSIIVLISLIIGFFSTKILKNVEGLHLGIGFLLVFIVVLPFHEWIHGLTFKSLKAPDVGYGISWKAGMVYAYAQNFPISMPELFKVAIMPFSIITPLLIMGMLWSTSYAFVFGFILLFHTIACIGDFALVRYALKHKHRTIYTYDDIIGEKKTYFVEKL